MLTLALAALPTLVINEVLYDPKGPDTGREFVEILNVSGIPQSLLDVELQCGDGAHPGTWRAVWRGAPDRLEPGALYVVAGDSVAAGDALLAGSLQNGPDALRLVQSGEPVDLLGYGDLQSPELFEGAPAEDVSGVGLSRIPDGHDTDTNAADFHSAPASPGRLNAPHRALQLQLQDPDPTRLWPWRSVEVRARVSNIGLDAWEAGTYDVTATLWRVRGEPAEGTWSLEAAGPVEVQEDPATLAAGDSVAARLGWNAELGLFQLRAALHAAGSGEAWRDSLFLRVGAGAILVNEILFAPKPGDHEWIELFNRDVRAHDLNGWTLSDAGGRRTALRTSAILLPGSYALVEADTTSTGPGTEGKVLRVQASPWPSLNNSDADDGFADAVLLRDVKGIVDDAFRYRAAWGAGKGRSIERLTADPDARGLLWAACKDPSGSTPGRRNSADAPPGWSSQLRVQPNPFSPDGDGHADLLGIAFEVPVGHMGFRVHLFDSSGRRRRSLGGDHLGPGPRRLAWDGTDDGGVPLPTGVYVLQLQLLGGDAAVQLRSIGLVRP